MWRSCLPPAPLLLPAALGDRGAGCWQVGDVLKSVDGEGVCGKPLEEVVPMIVGQVGAAAAVSPVPLLCQCLCVLSGLAQNSPALWRAVAQEGTALQLGLARAGRELFVFLVRGCSKTAAHPSIGACAEHHPATSPQQVAARRTSPQPAASKTNPQQMRLDPDRVQTSARPASTKVKSDERGYPGGSGGERRGSERKNVTGAFPSLDYFSLNSFSPPASTPASLPANTSSRMMPTSGGNGKSGGPEPQLWLNSGVGRRRKANDGMVKYLKVPGIPHTLGVLIG